MFLHIRSIRPLVGSLMILTLVNFKLLFVRRFFFVRDWLFCPRLLVGSRIRVMSRAKQIFSVSLTGRKLLFGIMRQLKRA